MSTGDPERPVRQGIYTALEPYESGMLDAGDGNLLYWETCGNRRGKPALVLHGGPGSGCTAWHRRLFDPSVYRIVLFDQRSCGRSTPHASDPSVSLEANTTWHLIADVELLREHLGIERWLVLGGSWGCTLALAYAEQHPERASELVLFGVTTGRHSEFDWLFRGGVAAFFPEQWERLRAALPENERHGDIVDAYARLLHHPDPSVRERAAYEWCLWESATPTWPPSDGLAPRFADPKHRMAFARIVTHCVRHNAWIEDGRLLRDAEKLQDIPGAMINGRFDFQSPIGNAWALKRVWPRAELVIVDDAGHAADNAGIARELVRATDRFAARDIRTPGESVAVTIREVSGDELSAVLAVLKTAYAEYEGVLDPPSGVTRETVQSLSEQMESADLVAAEVEGTLAGCVLYRAEPDQIYLGRLAVLPEFRGRGIGAALVRFVEQRAGELGMKRVRLGVRIVLRELQSWYQRQGYVITAEETHEGYDSPTFVIMEKDELGHGAAEVVSRAAAKGEPI